MPQRTGRRLAFALGVVGAAALVGCQGGPPTILGYRLGAAGLYDTDIKTVYVPVFYDRAFQATPYRGMEANLTAAVVKEIGARTPYKVISDPDRADTELKGNIVRVAKAKLNSNPQNLIREAELVVTVDVLWRDNRDGRILSAQRRGRNPGVGGQLPVDPSAPPFDPNVPPPPPAVVEQMALPVRLVGVGRVIPELGESSTTAEQRAINHLAAQIVSMMEKPW
ncbi:MAG: hypothetical protein K2X82_21225 [Gemmataceae bacterium]|nr:hypothetical protein [Gemmataceae bacterium]